MSDNAGAPHFHVDIPRFLAALRSAEARTRFSARLIEKDYYCSLVLRELGDSFAAGLVFKGGTSLSKVHADFFRLSEDLDFAISIDPSARRSVRRAAIEPFKRHFESLCGRLPWLRDEAPLTGHDDSRQYNAQVSYGSVVTGEPERLKIEIALREEILVPAEERLARTILTDPATDDAVSPPLPVRVLTLLETYAEKIRAALTRRDPAIRDFFDVDDAVLSRRFAFDDTKLLELIVRKLSVSANDPVDLSPARILILRGQIETQLRPVLRETELQAFDLDRVLAVLTQVARHCGRHVPETDRRSPPFSL